MCEQRRGVRIVHTNSEVTLECKLSLWSTGGIKGTETIKSTRKKDTNKLKSPGIQNRLIVRQKQWGHFYQLVNSFADHAKLFRLMTVNENYTRFISK